MKKLFSIVYYAWLTLSVLVAVYALATMPAIVWIGVLMASVAPLLNTFWRFDDGRSPSTKARYPKLSLCVLLGVAWVLLTVPELGVALWLVLGCLGGFLLYSYWVMSMDE